MQQIDWLERWQEGRIGFHKNEVNPLFVEFFPHLKLSKGSTVFFPLCGKTLDMLWVEKQGMKVLGAEMSPIACAAFFEENGLEFKKYHAGKFEIYEGGAIKIYCGDIFAMAANDLEHVDAVFDRAALIALTEDQRTKYGKLLGAILPKNTPILLVTFEYDQSTMNGPPFSVDPDEVKKVFKSATIKQLMKDVDPQLTDRFKEQGLTSAIERVFVIHL